MRILCACVQALVLWISPQGEENPEYKSWVGFKAGSWARYKYEAPGAPATADLQQLRTLVEMTPDKVKLEQKDSAVINGKEYPGSVSPNTYDAKRPQGQKIASEREEMVEVAGKKLRCNRVEMLTELGTTKVTVIHWMSPEIPGGIAKSEISTEVAGTKTTSKFTVLAWEKK